MGWGELVIVKWLNEGTNVASIFPGMGWRPGNPVLWVLPRERPLISKEKGTLTTVCNSHPLSHYLQFHSTNAVSMMRTNQKQMLMEHKCKEWWQHRLLKLVYSPYFACSGWPRGYWCYQCSKLVRWSLLPWLERLEPKLHDQHSQVQVEK